MTRIDGGCVPTCTEAEMIPIAIVEASNRVQHIGAAGYGLRQGAGG